MTVEMESCEVVEKFDSVGETRAGRSSVVVLFERKEVAVGEGVIETDDLEETPRIIDESESSDGIYGRSSVDQHECNNECVRRSLPVEDETLRSAPLRLSQTQSLVPRHPECQKQMWRCSCERTTQWKCR